GGQAPVEPAHLQSHSHEALHDLEQEIQELNALPGPAEIEVLTEVYAALADGAVSIEFPDDPKSWKEAMASDKREQWIGGATEELQSLKDLNVYKLVPRDTVPRDRKILKGRLLCTRKRDEAGVVKRHKVRFVCKGFEQVFGQDYNKTTAPTARMESFRALLQIAAARDWDARQFDVKTAFLYGILPEEEAQYMEQPEGFEEPGKEDWVWLLQKGLLPVEGLSGS
ncbi:hypothetical protein EVG20_g9260, partial [Dentipellis fragilis]